MAAASQQALTVLLCGCTDATSHALCAAFAAAGCHVFACAPQLEQLAALQQRAGAAGVHSSALDPAADAGSAAAVVQAVASKTGRRRVDVLVVAAVPPGCVGAACRHHFVHALGSVLRTRCARGVVRPPSHRRMMMLHACY